MHQGMSNHSAEYALMVLYNAHHCIPLIKPCTLLFLRYTFHASIIYDKWVYMYMICYTYS